MSAPTEPYVMPPVKPMGSLAEAMLWAIDLDDMGVFPSVTEMVDWVMACWRATRSQPSGDPS